MRSEGSQTPNSCDTTKRAPAWVCTGSPAHLHTPPHSLKPAPPKPTPCSPCPNTWHLPDTTAQQRVTAKGRQPAMQGANSSPACFSKQCSEHRAQS